MRNFWIVLGRTYWDRVRTKIFIGMTLLLIGGGIFLFLFSNFSKKFSGEKEKQSLYLFLKHPMLRWINLILVKLCQNGIGL